MKTYAKLLKETKKVKPIRKNEGGKMKLKLNEISVGIGLGDLWLGSTRNKVLKLLGQPSKIETEDFNDGSSDIIWKYEDLGIQLSFSSEDNWLLDSITSSNPEACLDGMNLISLSEEEFLAQIKNSKIQSVVLDEDLPELKLRSYELDDLGLSFWLYDGKVISITIMVLFDTPVKKPMWPKGR